MCSAVMWPLLKLFEIARKMSEHVVTALTATSLVVHHIGESKQGTVQAP